MTLKNIKYVTRHIIEKGIHLTPITGFSLVNTTSDCNHSTPLAFQFNVLRAVTELHNGETNEN